MNGAILIALILVLVLLGARLFVIVGASTAACFMLFTHSDVGTVITLDRIVTKMESLTTKNVFLSIPFFIASGAIMTNGGIARRLTDMARAMVGWMPGGLAVASVVACIVFAAISGSSPVTLVAVGAIMFPALVQSGYPERFSIGILTSAGSLGCMIPPAIAMLIYAISVQGSAAVDPADLFFAGIVPALFIAGLLAAYAVWVGFRIEGARQPFDGGELWRTVKAAGWSLTLPALVLGGIYGGAFTPTEAGAMAFAASVVIAVFIHRDVQIRQLPAILAEASVLMGSLILIVVLAFGLNDFLAEVDAPGVIKNWVEASHMNSWQFLLLVNVILIVLGALMDSISATLVFAPILAPVAINHFGMDPIHFGIVFVVNMEIGYLAPPVATNLFVAAAIFRRPFLDVARAVMPTLGLICAALVVIMYVPTISKGPLNLRNGDPFYESFPWEGKVVAVVDPTVDGAAPAADAAAADGPKKPLTLQEMMKAAKERGATDPNAAPAADAEAADRPKKPLTLQEMMKAAKEKAAAEQAGEPDDAAPTP